MLLLNSFFENRGLNKKMKKKKQLVWRLSKLPTTEELRALVKDKIITQDEARDILFSTSDRSDESLKTEIKFLRELVDKLSQNNRETLTIIKELEIPYRRSPWYYDYVVVSSETSGTLVSGGEGGTNYTSFRRINNF